MYELREGDRDEFFSVPFACYPADTPYVSPLRSDLRRMLSETENPLFAGRAPAVFTVRRAGRPVGRIVAHIHEASNRRHGLSRSYFGFFDCADDLEAARLLLDAAEGWGRQRGCSEIAGNFNLTAMQQIGVMTGGHDRPPYSDQLYTPAHIPRLLSACGYEPFFPTSTFEVDVADIDPAKLLGPRQTEALARTDLQWVPLSRRTLARQLRDVRLVLNDGFDDNPMFVPLTEEEFLFQARDLMWVIDPRLPVLVYCDGTPVGVVVCIPDLNPLIRATRSRLGGRTPGAYLRHRLMNRRAVIIFYSVFRALHDQGLNGAMLATVIRALKARGYRQLGITWISDENKPSLRQVEKLGARPMHRLHLFRKRLTCV